MGFIAPWYVGYLTPDYPNKNWINQRGELYPKQNLKFNFWIKFTQQWTVLTWHTFLTYSQSIDYDKCNHETITLSTTFLNTTGELFLHFRFGCGPKKIFYHTQGQLSVSINAYPTNEKIWVNNEQNKSWLVKLKDILDQ